MTHHPSPVARLNTAAAGVMQHIHRYTVGTNASIHADVLPQISLNAVSKVTASLVKGGQLRRHPLSPPHYYFTLGPRGIGYFGASRRRVQPLGPQALPSQFGPLFFCTLGDERRPRLLPSELRTRFPWLPSSELDLPYYLDVDDQGSPALALIRTDSGVSADYLARRCESALARRRSLCPEFAQLINRGQFMVAFVVPTPEKATALKAALDRRAWTIRFRIAICPQLLLILARFSHGA